jgi:hypothetical protein
MCRSISHADSLSQAFHIFERERLSSMRMYARFSLVGLVPVDYLAVIRPSQSL